MTEDEMAGWHHQLDGHKFEQALEDREGQGRLVCCSPWDRKELDTTKELNSNIKKTQTELLNIKTIMSEMKNTLGRINSGLVIVKNRISELEDIAIEKLRKKRNWETNEHRKSSSSLIHI